MDPSWSHHVAAFPVDPDAWSGVGLPVTFPKMCFFFFNNFICLVLAALGLGCRVGLPLVAGEQEAPP